MCGRTFTAGLVRVPRAWGEGGDAMAEAARLPFPYPEAAVVDESSLEEQNLAIAADLPARPIILGGCCCAHIGAVQGLASRQGRMAVVWIDAHGDLNTIESSPSGNPWATPLRTLIDAGTVNADDVVLVAARNLDPPEEDFIASSGVHVGEDGLERALDGVGCAYIAFDCDALAPGEIAAFMPEPGGPTLGDAEAFLLRIRERASLLGAGFTAFLPEPENVPKLERL
ncbi:MAG TPA: arginase family protein, partial [Gaiellaceae bacterium]|nr:arginase family protein [Gaiellaceae bacterium]